MYQFPQQIFSYRIQLTPIQDLLRLIPMSQAVDWNPQTVTGVIQVV